MKGVFSPLSSIVVALFATRALGAVGPWGQCGVRRLSILRATVD